MEGSRARHANARSILALGVSVAALCAAYPASAQLCGDGSSGPVCTVVNTGTRDAVTGTQGNATFIENSGTISGAPAIDQAGSILLSVNNAASGTIDGSIKSANAGIPQLAFLITNAGTINGDVVFNDAPAPNVFTGTVVAYVSDGGTLNGDLRLGTTGFTTSLFLQRGADDGIMGTLSAGAGIDIFARSYTTTQSIALGGYAKPGDFEIDGYEVLGGGTTLTLTGSGTTISLMGDGNVVNNATINLLNAASAFPPGVEVVPAAIGYFQTRVASFRRDHIAPGQPNGVFTMGFGNALNSFTNAGIVNGDIRLATATFTNANAINLNSRSAGTVIFGAANKDFLFNNTGNIIMADTGARLGTALYEAEFEDGTNAAVRIRSALDTTEAKDVGISNSGSIVGGLNAVVAARNFAFENSGSIAGIETGTYFSRGLSLNVGELNLVFGENARDEFNGERATFLNTATGTISHGASADLAAQVVRVENHGVISASGSEYGVALLVEQDMLQDDDEANFDAESFTFINSGTLNGSAIFEPEAQTATFVNSGTVTRSLQPLDAEELPLFGAEYSAFEISSETVSDQALSFTNTGSIRNLDRGSSALTIEIDAEDDDPAPGTAPRAVSANVHVANSGLISAEGGATVTPRALLPGFLPEGTVLFNPIAGLSVDASDVSGDSNVTIENQLGGTIAVSGNVGVTTQTGYLDQGDSSNGVSAVAVVAQGKVINITNAGLIRGGVGTNYGPNARFDSSIIRDDYLAGAIHTFGEDYDDIGYVGSIDHVVNTATGEIIGSIDLGANDDVIENYGSITGNVFLRDGNDTFIHSLLGSYDGLADGGAGEDTLVFDITGAIYTGVIDPVLRAKFINFEIEKLVGKGTVIATTTQSVGSEGLVLDDDSTIDVGAGNVAYDLGEDSGPLTIRGGVVGDVALQGSANEIINQTTVQGSVIGGDGSYTIANAGMITGDVTLGDGGSTFTNAGLVEGNVSFGAGADTLVLTGDWSIGGTVSGGDGTDAVLATFGTPDVSEADLPIVDLSGFESIEQFVVEGGIGKVGGTAAFEDVIINDGRLIGAKDSVITGDVEVKAGGTFGSAGTVNGDLIVGAGGTLSPGASPEVMILNGDVTLGAGSVTVFEFVPAPGQSDQIIINGDLTIASGAILNLVGDRPLTPGVAYDMIVAESIAPGTFTIGTWDRSAVQGFLRYTPTKLQLLGTFVAAGEVAGQTGAAIDYVNDLLIAGEASAPLLGAIPTLLDTSGFASAAAFAKLSPEAYATASQLGIEHGLSLVKATRSGASASLRSEAGFYTFAEGLGDWRTLKGSASVGVSRATSNSYGLLGGIGYGSQDVSVGAFIGYLDSRQRIAGLGAKTDTDGIVAGVSGHLKQGGFDLSALIAYDWTNAKTERSVPGNVDVTSKYNLGSLVLDASAGYSVPVSADWALRPELGITHISTRRSAASESCSAAFALAVDRERTKATFVDAALTLRGGQKADASFQPWVQAGVRHQLDGSASLASAGFIGTSTRFTVLGAERKETMYTAGAGFSADLNPRLKLFAAYQGEFGGGDGSHANVGIRLAF